MTLTHFEALLKAKVATVIVTDTLGKRIVEVNIDKWKKN